MAIKENGSPTSGGGYGGAKRMLWFMAKYVNGVSVGIHFELRKPRVVS
jgi:hypothetical protein